MSDSQRFPLNLGLKGTIDFWFLIFLSQTNNDIFHVSSSYSIFLCVSLYSRMSRDYVNGYNGSSQLSVFYPWASVYLQQLAWRQVEHFISPVSHYIPEASTMETGIKIYIPVSHYIPAAASMETGRTLHIPGILLYPCCSSHRNM